MVPQTMGLREAWPADVAQRTEMPAVPFFPQLEYQCGPAALATSLVHAGVQVTPDELVKWVYLPAREGSLQVEMLAATRRYGRVAYALSPQIDDLLREVAAGNPVIVLQDTGVGPVTNWHYAVVVGFDYPAGELYLRSGQERRLAIPFTVFEYTWKRSGYWAMTTMRPDRIPATATEQRWSAAVTAMDRVGDPPAAMQAYSTLLERWPGNLAASIGLANRHHALGNLAEAERVLRRGLVQHPDSAPLLNNLAQTLSDMGRNDEALVILQGAVAPEGSTFAAALRDTLAVVQQRIRDQKTSGTVNSAR